MTGRQALCGASRHALSGPVSAENGLTLCRVCVEGIERDTLDLVRLHDDLLDDQAWRAPSDAPIVTGTRERPLMILPRQAAARAQIEIVLLAWAQWIVATRELYWPTVPTVTTAAATIVANRDWLVTSDEGVRCADALRELPTGWVRSVAQPSGTVKAHAGKCPICKHDAEGIIHPADDSRESTIVCTANGDHRWPPSEWPLVLGSAGDERPTVDTSAAAVLLRIDESSLRALTSRGRIARSANGGYALADLHALYGELWGSSM